MKWFLLSVVLISVAAGAAAQDRAVPESRQDIQLSFSPVVKQTSPAVVNIFTKRKVIDQGMSPFFNDPFFQQFFGQQYGVMGMPRERIVSSLGSGVIVDAKGTVVTNFHVIKGAEDITAVLSDRRELAAELVASDEQSDLAILRLQTTGEALPYLQLHDSDSLEVGDLLLAIGNPFGVGQTVTSGIVSAVARAAANINDYGFFIQTDAAINPGNSGGALVDMQGRLVGIPTAIYSRSGGNIGIGFAIPSNMVRALLSGEARNGKIIKPWLGAQYQSVTGELAESLALPRPAGALVGDVFADSPAERGGLRVGDVIVSFGGKAVEDVQALRFRTAISPVNQPIPVVIIRDGKEETMTVTLETPPENPPRDVRKLEGPHPLSGLSVANLNPALAAEMNINPNERGVIIVARMRGLQVGDMILEVNGSKITSTAQLEKLLEKNAGSWRIQFKRDNQILNMAVVP